MKTNFKQRWQTFSPIPTKRTITRSSYTGNFCDFGDFFVQIFFTRITLKKYTPIHMTLGDILLRMREVCCFGKICILKRRKKKLSKKLPNLQVLSL